MKLANPFTTEQRVIYMDHYQCLQCGRSDKGIELNHITGRDSSSTFNISPLCTLCHTKIIHTQEEEKRLFQWNLAFLVRAGYTPVEADFDFIEAHPWLVL